MIMPANKTSMILTRVRRYVRKDISDAKMDDSLGGVFLVPFQDISVEGVALALAPLPVGDHRCIKALQEQGDQRKDRLVVHLLLGATAGQGVGDGHCVGTHLDESRQCGLAVRNFSIDPVHKTGIRESADHLLQHMQARVARTSRWRFAKALCAAQIRETSRGQTMLQHPLLGHPLLLQRKREQRMCGQGLTSRETRLQPVENGIHIVAVYVTHAQKVADFSSANFHESHVYGIGAFCNGKR